MSASTNSQKIAASPAGEFEDWQRLTPPESVARLGTCQSSGLSSAEAARRLQQHGPNQLVTADARSGWTILFAQLQSSLVVLLLVAMLASWILGEINDAIAILAIVVLNTLLGYWQDFQAEKSLAALKKLSAPDSRVWRDGELKNVPASELVPGDLVDLEAGFFVPADSRVLDSSELAIDEAALTGESIPVTKSTAALDEADLPLGDRTNMAWMGTLAVRGRGLVVVTGSGMNTQLGKIADSLQAVKPEPTPLQRHLAQLSRALAVIALVVVGLVFLGGLAAGQSARLMLMTALSMAVAIVPEGLPAVATVTLALGARRMFRRNALIRQLPAVETLGSVSVICSDKTGTLTQNRMTANTLHVAERTVTDQLDETARQNQGIQLLLLGGCLCNNSRLIRGATAADPGDQGTSAGEPLAVGDPTETALVEAAARFGLLQPDLQSDFPRLSEIAFDSERKRMATLHSVSDNQTSSVSRIIRQFPGVRRIVLVKGGFDQVLELCTQVWTEHGPADLDRHHTSRLVEAHNHLASRGARVLAVAWRPATETDSASSLEQNLIFTGMFGLTDPPRGEAKTAVELCRRAGIRPVMITGDHPLTAISIARDLGISSDDAVVTGQQLSRMSDAELATQVTAASVYARVAPADKLRIVEALQHHDEVVAMTGDGVNDAPALKQAHIGVAMGQTGTDVAREASSMVLLDDNFATIVSAVEQGRIVYDNVRKFVRYAMSGNVGEVLVMTLGLLFGLPLPLVPLQILWVNLVTDGLPGLALAAEPAEKNTMNRPPIPKGEPIFNRKMTSDVLSIGVLIGLVSLGTGSLFGSPAANVDHWRTLVFTVLTMSQLGNALACRSEAETLWNMGAARNYWLWAALAVTFLLQLAVIYVGPLQTVFHTCSLSWLELLVCIGASLLVLLLIECRKLVLKSRRADSQDPGDLG